MGKMTPEGVNQQFKKYAALAHRICSDVPINLHAHQIRHAKASHWLEDGMNIVQISFLLGHANLEIPLFAFQNHLTINILDSPQNINFILKNIKGIFPKISFVFGKIKGIIYPIK